MIRHLRYSILIPLAVLALSLACGAGSSNGTNGTAAPTISSFSPTSGIVGASVVLTGTNLTGATTVKFNGTVASSFSVSSSKGITVTVPAGATTGTLSVTTASGTGTSSADFTVTTPTIPVVLSFNPTSGKAGDTVNVTGSGFLSISSVTLAGTGCTYSANAQGTSISLTVPQGAAGTGLITVTNTQGTGTSATAFSVQPTSTGMNPQRGPISTPVVFTGTGFAQGSSVTFDGIFASTTWQSAVQLTATVPNGATAGTLPVKIITNGVSVSAGNFTVGAAGTTQDLSIDGLYIVQSVQDYSGSVPLVANRDAYLRVFVKANEASVPPPTVQVTITNGSTTWSPIIVAPSGLTETPTTISEGQWGSSWNLFLPAAQMQPGATLLAQVNPTGTIPEVDGTNNRFPISGTPAALNIQTVKTFKTTLVAITQQGLTGNVSTGRTPASWADRLKRMYPINAVDVQVRSSALTTTANLNSASSTTKDGSGWDTALGELEAKRVAEASDRYYFGCVNVNYTGGTAGLGYVPYSGSSSSRSALGWDKTGGQDGYNYPEIFAHEVGHNFGRQHAPCRVSDPDPNWPTDPAHATANIGVYGYDVVNAALKSPTAKDIMSYCNGNLWLSDYSYKGVFSYRAAGPIGDIQTLEGTVALDSPQECLLISGSIRNGKVELHPSFQVNTVPSALPGGSHELLLEDIQGAVLQRIAFEPVLIADLPEGQDIRHFTFAIPMDAASQSSLQRISVGRGIEVLAERQTTHVAVAARGVREPVVMSMKPGKIHLSWDHGVHRKVMVRDPRTGEVIAFLEGGSAMLETDARELECTFSDGVRSERRMMKVAE